MKYITRIGQNTGMSKTSKKVQKNAIVVDFIVDSLKLANKKIIIPVSKSVNIQNKKLGYQNLNSGRRRINGRNSSLLLFGRTGPSSSESMGRFIF
jgi:hypothetical protein